MRCVAIVVLMLSLLSCHTPTSENLAGSDAQTVDLMDVPDSDADQDAETAEIWIDSGSDGLAPPDEDVGDAFEIAEDATTVAPAGACLDNVSLPVIGQACAKEGAVHCSRVDEKSLQVDTYGLCVRPNAAICSQVADGTLRWQLAACPGVSDACKVPGAAFATCQENSRGAHCCPLAIANSLTPNGYLAGSASLCSTSIEGKSACNVGDPSSDGGLVQRCTFYDQTAGTPAAQSAKESAFGPCAATCKDCLYGFVDQICPPIDWITCNGCGGFDANGSCMNKGQGRYCLHDGAIGGAACVTD